MKKNVLPLTIFSVYDIDQIFLKGYELLTEICPIKCLKEFHCNMKLIKWYVKKYQHLSNVHGDFLLKLRHILKNFNVKCV